MTLSEHSGPLLHPNIQTQKKKEKKISHLVTRLEHNAVNDVVYCFVLVQETDAERLLLHEVARTQQVAQSNVYKCLLQVE